MVPQLCYWFLPVPGLIDAEMENKRLRKALEEQVAVVLGVQGVSVQAWGLWGLKGPVFRISGLLDVEYRDRCQSRFGGKSLRFQLRFRVLVPKP